MHANIIDGGTKGTRADFVRSQTSGLVDVSHVETEKSSITIKQIQELVASLSTHASLPRFVRIEEANLMTIPAQNALLKSLEEPPENTTFFLTTDRAASLLPTIRSRTVVTHLESEPLGGDAKHLPLIKEAMSATLGNRLQLATQVSTDRAEAVEWFNGLLTEINATLQKTAGASSQTLLAGIAHNALNASRRLKANCSVGLTTQNFFLHLPKTK
jgi:hypothetical protein